MNNANSIHAIHNYILYLKSCCGLSVSLHPDQTDNMIIPTELISFNIHDNPYCTYLKTCNEAKQHCIQKQQKVHNQCKTGSYCGICYAGVKEYIYPINNGLHTVGFISVSGYQTEKSSEYLDRISAKYKVSKDQLATHYTSLKKEIPPKKYVDTLIEPLCQMLELAYCKERIAEELPKNFNQQLLQYLRLHHTEDITYKDICTHFSYSRSYISHHFKQSNGKSLREYINMLRVDDAKTLLAYSELNITEIAIAVGFNECAYFSRVFKKYTGMSPQKFRIVKR